MEETKLENTVVKDFRTTLLEDHAEDCYVRNISNADYCIHAEYPSRCIICNPCICNIMECINETIIDAYSEGLEDGHPLGGRSSRHRTGMKEFQKKIITAITNRKV